MVRREELRRTLRYLLPLALFLVGWLCLMVDDTPMGEMSLWAFFLVKLVGLGFLYLAIRMYISMVERYGLPEWWQRLSEDESDMGEVKIEIQEIDDDTARD